MLSDPTDIPHRRRNMSYVNQDVLFVQQTWKEQRMNSMLHLIWDCRFELRFEHSPFGDGTPLIFVHYRHHLYRVLRDFRLIVSGFWRVEGRKFEWSKVAYTFRETQYSFIHGPIIPSSS